MSKNLPARNPERVALLDQIEAKIEGALREALEQLHHVRIALTEIRDQELWRDADENYGSWDDYCEERWSINRSAAYRAVTWAREMIAELGSPEAVLAADPEALLSEREAQKRARARARKLKKEAEERAVAESQAEVIEATAVISEPSGDVVVLEPTVIPDADEPDPLPAPPTTVAPEQLSLFGTDVLLDEVAARVEIASEKERLLLVRRLRAIISGGGTKAEPASRRCSCKKPDVTGYGYCRACGLRRPV